MDAPELARVVLYSKDGCGLCDEARVVLVAQQERTPFELVEVDIESSDELLKEYGIRIPVVDVDGREEFEVTVDARALERLLADR